MGRLSAFLPAFALLAALAVGLSACGGGGDELVPENAAKELNAHLDEVRRLAGEGDCGGASEVASSVTDQVAELNGVASKLKDALNEGAARLSEVVASCEEVPSEAEEEVSELEAEEAAREAEEEAEQEEQREKPEKEKPDEEKPEKETGPPAEPPEPPGQEKKEEKEEVPPVETENGGNSGGVGPGAAVEGGE